MAESGGLQVIRPKPLNTKVDVQEIFLMSDLHLGVARNDENLIVQELELANALDGRVLIGGDLLDLILPVDRKRYTPDVLHPRLRGRKDVLNEAVEMAVELLDPYVHLLDGVGIGNHEASVEKNHSYDALRAILERLNTTRKAAGLGPIPHMGYMSFVQYRVGKDFFTIWYYHGSNHPKNTAAALNYLAQQTVAFQADVYWQGHVHMRGNMTEVRMHPNKQGDLVARDIKLVVSGSYMQTYNTQSQASMKKHGRLGNYAADEGLRPHGLGGAAIRLLFDGDRYPKQVAVIQ